MCEKLDSKQKQLLSHSVINLIVLRSELCPEEEVIHFHHFDVRRKTAKSVRGTYSSLHQLNQSKA